MPQIEYKLVQGSDLKIGDQILVICEAYKTNQYDHIFFRSVSRLIMVDGQHLWTWGKGAGTKDSIMKIDSEYKEYLRLKEKYEG